MRLSKKKRYTGYSILIVVVAVLTKMTLNVLIYNRFVDEAHFMEIAYGRLATELIKRKTVNTMAADAVTAYVNMERRVMDVLVTLNGAVRAGAGNYDSYEVSRMQDELRQLLARLSLLAEASPNIKAKGPYLYYMETIYRTEQGVIAARLNYNMAVYEYNMFLDLFPYRIFARLYGFHKVPFFEAGQKAHYVPRV
ncbi:MAG: LemA family protein [Nitrospirae bacterium]|nr:LemA family protein [Nitrospirota bacterium]